MTNIAFLMQMLKKNPKFAYMALRLSTYYHSEDIPALPGDNLFHSTELFRVLEQTPGYTPVMLVAFEGESPVGKLLSITRRQFSLWGGWSKTFVYGVGDYFEGSMKREEVFREMLAYLTLRHEEDSFLIEFRNLEEPLFGYRYFRANGYFPVKWLRVRNSIHQELIDKWMSASRKRQIHNGLKHGAVMEVARSEEDVCALFTMLRQYYLPKVHRYFPDIRFFLSLISEPSRRELGKIFVVKYKGKVIGGSVCLFSGDCTYLLFSGGMRKSYAWLYPGVLAVWNAMLYAREQGYAHFEFIDAGLPFRRYGFRDFILRFGGKQLSSRRWFWVRWEWLNRLLIKIYV